MRLPDGRTPELLQMRHRCQVLDEILEDAPRMGEKPLRLNLIAVWREATVFADAQRAALELTEHASQCRAIYSAFAARGIPCYCRKHSMRGPSGNCSWARGCPHLKDGGTVEIAELVNNDDPFDQWLAEQYGR